MNLDAVRDALLADARDDADGILAVAERDAAITVAAAREEAEAMLAGARADGEREARALVATELARARREARELILRARRDTYDGARAAVRDAACALRDTPRYDALIDALTGLARRQLGEGAVLAVDGEDGGLVARAGSRTVDYRLPAIADRCFAAAGPALEALWR